MTRLFACTALCAATIGPCLSIEAQTVQNYVARWADPTGDACYRRSDSEKGFPVIPGSDLPDVVSIALSAWEVDDLTDPYIGHAVRCGTGHILNVEIRLAGLVCPPGTGGEGGSAVPTQFGPTPLLGFIEFDVDEDHNTGGEIGAPALTRFMANAARFGGMPRVPFPQRVIREGTEIDTAFNTGPQFERSGADFALVFCGCHETEIEEVLVGDGDEDFEAGETWIVRNRFFQRAGGYRNISSVVGGSDFGQYDPHTCLKFCHDAATDTTIITLVFPLDAVGAATLANEDVQPYDDVIELDGSHCSVAEALWDVINGANTLPMSGATRHLSVNWQGRSANAYLDPTRWRAMAILGTSYAWQTDAPILWTDTGFGAVFGDVNGDLASNEIDKEAIRHQVESRDGGPTDGDGERNGQVVLVNAPRNFSLYDLNYDGILDWQDYDDGGDPTCKPDWNHDLDLDSQDYFEFLEDFFNMRADYNADGPTDSQDFFEFLNDFFEGCAQVLILPLVD